MKPGISQRTQCQPATTLPVSPWPSGFTQNRIQAFLYGSIENQPYIKNIVLKPELG
jgi:hypothetical protein